MLETQKRAILILLILILPAISSAQGFFRSSFWKQYRKEVCACGGASNFLGELGGKDQVGTDFVQDLEISETKYVLNAGFRYFITKDLAAKASLYYGVVSGDDETTEEIYRNNRNIHFQSPLAEASIIAEYHVVQERSGRRYKLRGAKKYQRTFIFGVYGFAGIGAIYFDPRAKYQRQGKWLSLKGLNTEGQGLPGGPKDYSGFSIAIPMGIGLRYSFTQRWRLGLEAGLRKTFTDYIDDVSSNYYDNNEINRNYGEQAAWFADPSKEEIPCIGDPFCPNSTGQQRGDITDNDAYMFLTLCANYKLYKRRGFRRIKSRRSVPSF